MPLLGDVQADYVELKLQEAALLNLSSGQHQGELMALDPGLVRAWGDGSQLPTVRQRLAAMEQRYNIQPAEWQQSEHYREGLQKLKARHVDR
jgi:hypothetical protein